MTWHWHAVAGMTANGKAADSIEADHQVWHETGEPCIFCGAISWTEGTHHLTPSALPLKPCGRDLSNTSKEK